MHLPGLFRHTLSSPKSIWSGFLSWTGSGGALGRVSRVELASRAALTLDLRVTGWIPTYSFGRWRTFGGSSNFAGSVLTYLSMQARHSSEGVLGTETKIVSIVKDYPCLPMV